MKLIISVIFMLLVGCSNQGSVIITQPKDPIPDPVVGVVMQPLIEIKYSSAVCYGGSLLLSDNDWCSLLDSSVNFDIAQDVVENRSMAELYQSLIQSKHQDKELGLIHIGMSNIIGRKIDPNLANNIIGMLNSTQNKKVIVVGLYSPVIPSNQEFYDIRFNYHNRILKLLVEGRGWDFVDLSELFPIDDPKARANLINSDGIFLNDKGHEEVLKLVFAKITE